MAHPGGVVPDLCLVTSAGGDGHYSQQMAWAAGMHCCLISSCHGALKAPESGSGVPAGMCAGVCALSMVCHVTHNMPIWVLCTGCWSSKHMPHDGRLPTLVLTCSDRCCTYGCMRMTGSGLTVAPELVNCFAHTQSTVPARAVPNLKYQTGPAPCENARPEASSGTTLH